MATTISTPDNVAATTLRVTNPRNGEELYTIIEPDATAIEAVFTTARETAGTISAMTVRQRLDALQKMSDYILEHKESIIDRIVSETGKTRAEALLTEIFSTLDLIQYYGKTAERDLADQKVPTPVILFGKKSRIFLEPLGTVLIISPWNYPFNLSMTPIITALVTGNSVVFKPSEYTPLKGLLEEIFDGSGFPKDIVQVVYGGKNTGRQLIDQQPNKVFFTGSEAAGKAIMAHCAQYLIPVELELGGKDPFIVFEDANIPRAANGALWGSYTNCGQTCTSVERIIVHESIYDKFVETLVDEMKHLKTPLQHTPNCHPNDMDMGCMTADFQVAKVEEQIDDAIAKGAKIYIGGKRQDDSHNIPPTLIGNVTPDMIMYAEETFGPVAIVIPFKDEAEAIRLANDTRYGLSSSVWTDDLVRAERVARAIVTGNVSINNVLATQGNAALPFGGTKASGMGRYKGTVGLHSFSNIKSVMIDKNSGRFEPIWYPYTAEKYALLQRLVDSAFKGTILQTIFVGLGLERLEKKRHY